MTLRTQIEKIIWKHYKPEGEEMDMALDVEALLDELMPVVEGKAKRCEWCEKGNCLKPCTCSCHQKEVDNSLTKENRTVDNHPLEEGWVEKFKADFCELRFGDGTVERGAKNAWLAIKSPHLAGRIISFFSQTLAQERKKWENEPMTQEHHDNIVRRALQEERAKVLAEVREKVEKMLQHYIKGSYYDEALNKVLSLLTDLQVKE